MSEIRIPSQPELPKRFYAEASVAEADGGHAVLLDGRSVKTPSRRLLVLPTAGLAGGIAAEWQAQRERIDPATMPLTRLANTVIDAVAADPVPVRDDMAKFAETDLLFYRADAPERLVALQRRHWDPILAWAEDLLGSRFLLAEGVMHVAQPPATVAAFRVRLATEADPFRIAALHQMTTLTGSAIIALAVAEAGIDLDAAWAAAHVDEDWNIERWGADAEAASRRARRFAEMRAAATVVGAAALQDE